MASYNPYSHDFIHSPELPIPRVESFFVESRDPMENTKENAEPDVWVNLQYIKKFGQVYRELITPEKLKQYQFDKRQDFLKRREATAQGIVKEGEHDAALKSPGPPQESGQQPMQQANPNEQANQKAPQAEQPPKEADLLFEQKIQKLAENYPEIYRESITKAINSHLLLMEYDDFPIKIFTKAQVADLSTSKQEEKMAFDWVQIADVPDLKMFCPLIDNFIKASQFEAFIFQSLFPKERIMIYLNQPLGSASFGLLNPTVKFAKDLYRILPYCTFLQDLKYMPYIEPQSVQATHYLRRKEMKDSTISNLKFFSLAECQQIAQKILSSIISLEFELLEEEQLEGYYMFFYGLQTVNELMRRQLAISDAAQLKIMVSQLGLACEILRNIEESITINQHLLINMRIIIGEIIILLIFKHFDITYEAKKGQITVDCIELPKDETLESIHQIVLLYLLQDGQQCYMLKHMGEPSEREKVINNQMFIQNKQNLILANRSETPLNELMLQILHCFYNTEFSPLRISFFITQSYNASGDLTEIKETQKEQMKAQAESQKPDIASNKTSENPVIASNDDDINDMDEGPGIKIMINSTQTVKVQVDPSLQYKQMLQSLNQEFIWGAGFFEYDQYFKQIKAILNQINERADMEEDRDKYIEEQTEIFKNRNRDLVNKVKPLIQQFTLNKGQTDFISNCIKNGSHILLIELLKNYLNFTQFAQAEAQNNRDKMEEHMQCSQFLGIYTDQTADFVGNLFGIVDIISIFYNSMLVKSDMSNQIVQESLNIISNMNFPFMFTVNLSQTLVKRIFGRNSTLMLHTDPILSRMVHFLLNKTVVNFNFQNPIIFMTQIMGQGNNPSMSIWQTQEGFGFMHALIDDLPLIPSFVRRPYDLLFQGMTHMIFDVKSKESNLIQFLKEISQNMEMEMEKVTDSVLDSYGKDMTDIVKEDINAWRIWNEKNKSVEQAQQEQEEAQDSGDQGDEAVIKTAVHKYTLILMCQLLKLVKLLAKAGKHQVDYFFKKKQDPQDDSDEYNFLFDGLVKEGHINNTISGTSKNPRYVVAERQTILSWFCNYSMVNFDAIKDKGRAQRDLEISDNNFMEGSFNKNQMSYLPHYQRKNQYEKQFIYNTLIQSELQFLDELYYKMGFSSGAAQVETQKPGPKQQPRTEQVQPDAKQQPPNNPEVNQQTNQNNNQLGEQNGDPAQIQTVQGPQGQMALPPAELTAKLVNAGQKPEEQPQINQATNPNLAQNNPASQNQNQAGINNQAQGQTNPAENQVNQNIQSEQKNQLNQPVNDNTLKEQQPGNQTQQTNILPPKVNKPTSSANETVLNRKAAKNYILEFWIPNIYKIVKQVQTWNLADIENHIGGQQVKKEILESMNIINFRITTRYKRICQMIDIPNAKQRIPPKVDQKLTANIFNLEQKQFFKICQEILQDLDDLYCRSLKTTTGLSQANFTYYQEIQNKNLRPETIDFQGLRNKFADDFFEKYGVSNASFYNGRKKLLQVYDELTKDGNVQNLNLVQQLVGKDGKLNEEGQTGNDIRTNLVSFLSSSLVNSMADVIGKSDEDDYLVKKYAEKQFEIYKIIQTIKIFQILPFKGQERNLVFLPEKQIEPQFGPQLPENKNPSGAIQNDQNKGADKEQNNDQNKEEVPVKAELKDYETYEIAKLPPDIIESTMIDNMPELEQLFYIESPFHSNNQYKRIILLMGDVLTYNESIRESLYQKIYFQKTNQPKFQSSNPMQYKYLHTALITILQQSWYGLTCTERHSDQWHAQGVDFFTSSNILKSLCYNNYTDFKKFFFQTSMRVPNNFYPENEEYVDWLNEEKNTPFQIIKLMTEEFLMEGCITFNTKAGTFKQRQEEEIFDQDRSHLYPLFGELIQVLTELSSGRFAQVQQKLLSETHERIFDKVNIFISRRSIRSIESEIYPLMDKLLSFMLGFIEGLENKEISLFSKFASYSDYYNMISYLIVTLYKDTEQLKANQKIQAQAKKALEEAQKNIEEAKNKLKGKNDQAQIKSTQNDLNKEKANINNPQVADQGIELAEMNPDGEEANLVQGKKVSKFTEKELETQERKKLQKEMIKGAQNIINLYNKDETFSKAMAIQVALKVYYLFENYAEVSGHDFKNQKYQIQNNQKNLEDNKLIIEKFEGKNQELKPKIENYEKLSAYTFLSNTIDFVEIRNNDNASVRVPFMRRPECSYIPMSVLNKYKNKCRIDDSSTKMSDLISFRQALFEIGSQNFKIARTSKPLYLVSQDHWFKAYNIVAFLYSMLINMVALWAYRQKRTVSSDGKTTTYKMELEYGSKYYEEVMLYMNMILVCYCLLFFFLWLISRLKASYMVAKVYYSPTDVVQKFLWIWVFFFDGMVGNFLWHIAMVFLTMYVHPVFVTLHMFTIVTNFETPFIVVQAVYKYFLELFSTLVFAVFMINFFATLISEFWYKDFKDKFVGDVQVCENFGNCLLYTVNWGFRNGGGISDSMKLTNYRDSRFPYKSLIDIAFFVFINIVALNIVFGIIIDAFAKMRNEAAEKQIDLENKCFVCGNERLEFETANIDFEKHITHEHVFSKYLFYIFSLQNLKMQDLNGNDMYVRREFEKKSTKWIPIGSTLYLTQNDDDFANKITCQLKEINEACQKYNVLISKTQQKK